MISDIVQTNKCCGCSACVHSCPTQAIQIKENSKGFFNAVVNVEKCVNCGICDKVCPVKKLDERTNIKCFAIKLHDNEALMKSQSGGAFFALAQKFLSQGGVDMAFQI